MVTSRLEFPAHSGWLPSEHPRRWSEGSVSRCSPLHGDRIPGDRVTSRGNLGAPSRHFQRLAAGPFGGRPVVQRAIPRAGIIGSATKGSGCRCGCSDRRRRGRQDDSKGEGAARSFACPVTVRRRLADRSDRTGAQLRPRPLSARIVPRNSAGPPLHKTRCSPETGTPGAEPFRAPRPARNSVALQTL